MDDDKVIITRKYTLIPEFSDRKEWDKRVRSFIKQDSENKIEYLIKKRTTVKGKAEKSKIDTRISTYKERIEIIDSGGEITQKMVSDYTYNLVRTAMEEEARRKNYILSWIFSEMRLHRVDCMETLKEKFKFISDTINYAYRTTTQISHLFSNHMALHSASNSQQKLKIWLRQDFLRGR